MYVDASAGGKSALGTKRKRRIGNSDKTRSKVTLCGPTAHVSGSRYPAKALCYFLAMEHSVPEAAQAKNLTDALRRSGVLREGRVTNVAVESSRTTILSKITRLRLTYEGAASNAPASLILKTGLFNKPDSEWSAGRQEVAFYTRVAPAMPSLLVPRCFDAAWNEDTREWHLILEDLTNSHAVATTWPLPPTAEQCRMIVRAWARFHASSELHWLRHQRRDPG